MKKDSYNKFEKVYRGISESVRTTFKLNENTHNIINWIIEEKNLKPKEVFDLIFDIEELVDLAIKTGQKNDKKNSTKTTRKTFVISQKALNSINKLSKEHQVSRDLIVEKLILNLKKFFEEFEKQEKQSYQNISARTNELLKLALKIEKEFDKELGKDNPILEKFGFAMVYLEDFLCEINKKIDN